MTPIYILVIQIVGDGQSSKPDITKWDNEDLPNRIAETFNLFDDFQAWVIKIDKTCGSEDFKVFMEYDQDNPLVDDDDVDNSV